LFKQLYNPFANYLSYLWKKLLKPRVEIKQKLSEVDVFKLKEGNMTANNPLN